MLAAAKRGLKTRDPKNNTFTLKPADDVSVGSNYAKIAERAKMYLNRVIKDHPNTPWAELAKRELGEPLGWKWEDSFTNLAPKVEPKPGNNNNNAKPQPERPTMLEKPKESRPLPKL
jgi:hypothetical protein